MKKTTITTAVLAGAVTLGLAGAAWAEGNNASHFGTLTIGTEGDTQTFTTVVTETAGKTTNGRTQAFDPAGPINAQFSPGDAGWSPRWELEDGTIFLCPLIGKPLDNM